VLAWRELDVGLGPESVGRLATAGQNFDVSGVSEITGPTTSVPCRSGSTTSTRPTQGLRVPQPAADRARRTDHRTRITRALPSLAQLGEEADAAVARTGQRDVWFGDGWVPTPVFDGPRLGRGP